MYVLCLLESASSFWFGMQVVEIALQFLCLFFANAVWKQRFDQETVTPKQGSIYPFHMHNK